MAAQLTLSKFLPKTEYQKRPRKVMDETGRVTCNGKRLGGPAFKKGHKISRKPHPSGKNQRQRAKEAYVPTGKPPGRFPKGHPRFGGKPVGYTQKYKLKDLIVAIKQVEEETGEDLMVHFVRTGFKNIPILKEIMKKLLPDLKHVDADIDVTEQFQLVIDASGKDDDDDVVDAEVVTPKALPAPKRCVKIKRRRKSA